MEAIQQEVGSMLREALVRSDTPVKTLAMETSYSTDAYYMAFKGKRSTPQDARDHIAGLNILGGLAVALEATGYKFFKFISGDRHPQTMLRLVEKEDREADAALKDVPYIILGKNKPEDLSDADLERLRYAGKETCDRIRADLNMICQLDDIYKLGLINYLLDKKEKTASPAAR